LTKHTLKMAGWISLFAFTSINVSASTGNYCIKPIKIIKRQIDGPANASKGPTKFLLAGQAHTPLAIDEVKIRGTETQCGGRGIECYIHLRTFWKFNANLSFEGPYVFDYSLTNQKTDGRTIYLSGGRNRTDTAKAKESHDGKEWETRFFTVINGGIPEQLGSPLNDDAWSYNAGRFNPKYGQVVTAYRNPPEGQQQHRSFLIKERDVVELKSANGTSRSEAIPNYLFPDLNIEVTTSGSSGVDIHDTKLRRVLKLNLPSIDESGGFESINIDRYGWMFVENGGNDFAVKWKQVEGRLKLDQLIKFTGRGWFGRAVAWLFNMGGGTRVDETHASAQCVEFSPELKLTIFCNPTAVLHKGQLEKIAGIDLAEVRYAGDATGKGVALLAKRVTPPPSFSEYTLYAFDGRKVQKLGAGSVEDFPELRRTFIRSKTDISEIVGEFPNLKLQKLSFGSSSMNKLDSPPYASMYPSLHTISNGNTLAAFSKDGIEIWNDGRWSWVWQGKMGSIHNTRAPVPVGVWNGDLFAEPDNSNYRLLTQCH
jgi:hypothetical protein